ncbi:MAG TPA: leucyl/phenylalanyl-tRNA--protein transferase [Acidimicrobiia bacterium]|nr:leucyl/phenylalanyl-tRNA--protein transferase [Acidimicrobiia bacterium]
MEDASADRATDFFEALDIAGAPRELVALGGTLDVPTIHAAYRAGCFPWPAAGPHEASLERDARRLVRRREVPLVPGTDRKALLMPWISPHPRPVLLPDQVQVNRSLRKRLRHCGWETTMDQAFDAVIAACAERELTWITPGMHAAYRALHHAGVAHSLEVWSGDDLVGGLYGIQTGRIFTGESMFHRIPDASKAAVVDLCRRCVEAGIVLIDTEDESDHMARLGQVLLHRSDYLDLLRHFRDEPVDLPNDRRQVNRLV